MQNISQDKARITFSRSALLIAFYAVAFIGISPSYGQQDQPPKPGHSSWKDPTDGWLDLSEMLAKPGHFVPIVMPITEPAVGYGLAGGPVFLRPRRSEGSEGWARPNVTVIGGLYTSNQSWGFAAIDSSSWKND